jgi:hypothetical protein
MDPYCFRAQAAGGCGATIQTIHAGGAVRLQRVIAETMPATNAAPLNTVPEAEGFASTGPGVSRKLSRNP